MPEVAQQGEEVEETDGGTAGRAAHERLAGRGVGVEAVQEEVQQVAG
jgi:hypothetical protein